MATSGEVRGLAVFRGQVPYGQKHVGLRCFNKLLLTLPSRDVRYRISIASPCPDFSSHCTSSREAGSSPPECFQTDCLWPFMRPHVLFFLPSVHFFMLQHVSHKSSKRLTAGLVMTLQARVQLEEGLKRAEGIWLTPSSGCLSSANKYAVVSHVWGHSQKESFRSFFNLHCSPELTLLIYCTFVFKQPNSFE